MFAASARSAALSAGLGRRAASTIAQKYSSAVFSAALNKSPQVLTKVQTELNAIQSAVKATPELGTFIHNPTLSTKDRSAGLPAIYAAAGKDVSDITKNLFVVLSENGRLVETEGVIEGFNELVANYKGELNVTITSAAPLPRDIQTRLETLLKQSQAAQKAKSLKITNKVNSAVLGGVVVDFGDKTIDLSVVSRVNKLNNLLAQRVDLTANLASILRRYPFSVGLFREIIQNSEDAKATKQQVFILDRQIYCSDSLLDASLAHVQGPALLACNDGVFSDEDWEGIRNVSQSSKVADTEKIGKHGLGSRAYYHLTDNPEYLSGGHLAIFDPHRWAFKHGGWRDTLENMASQYADQLEPFCRATSEEIGTYYSGTIVRLALRTASSQSSISSDKPSADRIHDLLVDFIQQELHLVLLFLSHLISVEVKEIDTSGRARTLASAKARSLPSEITVEYDATVRPSSSPSAGDWSILRASLPLDECVRLLSDALNDNLVHVQEELAREKLRPEVALAFQGASSQQVGGRLFTYLPLPLDTGFPCHIHGVFSLTDARQNLRNPSETIMSGTADALAVAWNKLLFSSIIPRAWLACMELVASGDLSLDLYQMLPPQQDRKTSGDAKYWTTLLQDVVRLAHTRDAKIWPVFNNITPTTYTALDGALIASESDELEHLRILARAGVNIILPPPALCVALLEVCSQRLTPKTVRPRLIVAPHLHELLPAERNTVVEFLLRDRNLEDLVDVPVIPLVRGGTVALSVRRRFGNPPYMLFSKEDAELFGQIEPQAVALHDLPTTARLLLVSDGSRRLNVMTLSCAKAGRYIREASSKFPYPSPSVDSWSWARSCEWLGAFWSWIADCPFRTDLIKGIGDLPLLPTTASGFCTPNEHVFSLSPDSDDSRAILSRIGMKFLHSSIPTAFLQQCRPTILWTISKPSDLLDALGSVPLHTIRDDGEATKIIQEQLSLTLNIYVRLTNSQEATLRALPIHPVLTNSSANCIQSCSSSLPATSKLCCLTSLSPLPLPTVDNTTFVHVTSTARPILEKIDYTAVVRPLSEQHLLQLHVDHIIMQSPAIRLRVLEHMVNHPQSRTSAVLDKLRKSPIIRVGGERYAAPQDVIDPHSPISSIVSPGDFDAIFDDRGDNLRIADALAQLGLLRKELDADYVGQRIISFRQHGASSMDAASRLLRTLDCTFYPCSGVRGIDEIAWIPTKAGLRTARETRDTSQRMLCDRVWDLLDMPPLRSPPLLQMLGWHEPIPVDILIKQLRQLLSESRGNELPQYLVNLITEFGHRYSTSSLSSPQVDQLFDLLLSQEWVSTSDGGLRQAPFAVFETPSRLRGFGQISLDFAARPGVKDFLLRMGCATRPTNDAIIMQLEALHQEGKPEDFVHESMELLRALDLVSLTEQQRARVLVPGVDKVLHTVDELFYNDLGSRMQNFVLPQSRVQVHRHIFESLRGALKIPSLGSLNLEEVDADSEDMREDLATRIVNVLRAYDIEQAFGEFLANADDAGATRFSIMLDDDPKRRASSDTVLCESMAPFCRGPALVIHNNAEFSMDDFRGIRRIGRGGKEYQDASIGRFGLGSLSFYHFAEVAMILSKSHFLLLDPSGRFLPPDLNKNSYLLPLHNIRRVYPGHLQLFDGLFGFRLEDSADSYQGTIIRLPLRTPKQAKQSALSQRSLTSDDIRAMFTRYRSSASRSLLFIRVSEVSALESGRAAPLWSTSAHRQSQRSVEGEPFDTQEVKLTDVDEWEHCQRSAWLVVRTTIPPDCYQRWEPVITSNRVKNVSVALAGELVPRTRGYHASQAQFFASLPLPLRSSLPVHVHASFILADDRRNIRWDGDGTLNDDSRFNHWLLTVKLPELYLFTLERWTDDDFPWPGTSTTKSPDPMSRAFIDAFYGDSEFGLIASSRQVLRSVTNSRIRPSSAVFRGGEPKTIKKILLRLAPTELVELPGPVRAELFRLSKSRARRVNPSFVSHVLIQSRDAFLEVYRSGEVTPSEIEDCVQYLVDGDLSSCHDRLVGCPLLPLACGRELVDVQRSDSTSLVFAGRWSVSPWPLFPPQRFLHPKFDQELLLAPGDYNLAPFKGSAVSDLMRHVISQAPRLEASPGQTNWIRGFWQFWDRALPDEDPDCLKDFPLIPTSESDTFVSLDNALTLPALGSPSLSSHRKIATTLQKFGAVIVLDIMPSTSSGRLPSPIRKRLRTVDFTFKRVMNFFARLNEEGDLQQKFSKLSMDEWRELADWIKDSIRELPGPVSSMRKQSFDHSFVDIARHLPIWSAHCKARSTTGSREPVFRALTDPLVRLLPSAITLVNPGVVLFLGKNPRLFFVQYSTEIARLHNTVTPMSPAEFAAQLDLPTQLPMSRFATYETFLDDLLSLSRVNGSFSGLKVPNEDRDMVEPSTLYKTIAEFRAAFAYRPQNFIHPRFCSVEDRLVPFGLRRELTRENFLACVQAVHEDYAMAVRESTEDRERCDLLFRWYSSQLPLTVGSDSAWWRTLDSYSFIPRHASRRSGGPAAFEDMADASPFRHLVSPSKVLREEYSSVAWTQRALFANEPDKRLYMVDEVVGIPTVEEVVKHLCVLTLRIAPNHLGNRDLLADIKATYEFLNEREAEARPYLRNRRRERLFLNVDDPLEDVWQFCAAAHMMFNVPDEDDRQGVRAFLGPFRNLLLAAGAEEIKRPSAPTLTPSSAEEELSRLRASFDGLRQSRNLTDVVFRIPGSGDELPAHRVLLATTSEYFHDLFCGRFNEGGPASTHDPIVITLKDVRELRCARLILEHIYTGRFEHTRERDTLLVLLELAHRWGVSEVKRRTEALLVNTITPATYLELKDHAEDVGATTLLEKIEEFAHENAFVLDELVDLTE
ncbi:hypothetical protein L226DRAFT_469097 [Lentinus tigrinus ALCF2SS1-7]|uniref:ATP synthase subunit 5, mitochondrial n=1 Tax=Lentinus tigrinus ALCF2SS1-6 TaxID=1328759 RepID=A0A5C2S085_9APHY|nr:hypothetical protein L227DRAFT_507793 [Lentinus tigrinus ALCF2SS1-6]RPD71133.1 hypothetical protein L226DRAFT_469097 [Lentinus tigrinus ALCF2SS1-7]